MGPFLLTKEERNKLKERGIKDIIKRKLLILRNRKHTKKTKEKKLPGVGYAMSPRRPNL